MSFHYFSWNVVLHKPFFKTMHNYLLQVTASWPSHRPVNSTGPSGVKMIWKEINPASLMFRLTFTLQIKDSGGAVQAEALYQLYLHILLFKKFIVFILITFIFVWCPQRVSNVQFEPSFLTFTSRFEIKSFFSIEHQVTKTSQWSHSRPPTGSFFQMQILPNKYLILLFSK